jgi:aminopeptidase N
VSNSLKSGTDSVGINDQNSSQIPINYPPSLYFNIDHMWLSVEPDFEHRTIKCKQQLKLTTRQETDKIQIDCAANETGQPAANNHKPIQIESVFLSDAASDGVRKKISYSISENKLIIETAERLLEGSKGHLFINYTAKGSPPGQGFHFIKRDEQSSKQAWTQGEAIESRNWFPCFDNPQIKFPREISVIVPENFIVISNGEMDIIDQEVNGEKKKKYVWEEPNPNPAYLTSITIGEFIETSKGEIYKGRVPLRYYVPKDREEDADRTFKDTSKMMEFFETFLDTEYPYSKYSQVMVEDFPYGGMENTTCTTLNTDYLHDKRAHLDFSSDDVITHELAHHWFGDLVTCKDWEHIWLNEGFASYFEALYLEHNKGSNESQYYLLQIVDTYIEASKLDKLALVTKYYRHPDEQFDFGHMYKKGGYVVHMLRNYIGNDDFRKSLKTYLERYKHKTAETDDLRQIFEEISGKSLEQFFDQWLFGKGHPQLEVKYSKENSTNNVKLIIEQKQVDGKFEFPVEIKLVLLSSEGKRLSIERTLDISERETEKVLQIPTGSTVEWFSIDPQLKILKEIKYIDIPQEIFIHKIENRKETTIIERIEAARNLREKPLDDLVEPLKRVVLEEDLNLEDGFWGVSLEAARTHGSIKSNKAYEALKQCFASVDNPKTKTALIAAIGQFKNSDSFDLLKPILESNEESYFVQQQAAIALGYTKNESSLQILEELTKTDTFRDLVARGAITGLRILGTTSNNEELITRVTMLIINKSIYGNHERIRRTATSELGFFVADQNGNIKKPGFNHLKTLLYDNQSVQVRNNAAAAFGRAFAYTNNTIVIDELKTVAENDPDGQVRKTARDSIELIKKKREIIDAEKEDEVSKFVSERVHLMEKRIPEI